MTIQERVFHSGCVDQGREAGERAALQAALSSRIFEASPRLASLLQYICDRYFEGDTDGIKEYSIATEVFRRPQSFDPATDSIVRVEVFRLRKKLREFYEREGTDQPIEIVVATGHYRPEFIDRIPQDRRPTQPADPAPEIDQSRQVGLDPVTDGSAGLRKEADRDDALGAAIPPAKLRSIAWARISIGAAAATILVVFFALWLFNRSPSATNSAPPAPTASPVPILPAGPEVRIRCGYSRPLFKDDEGNVWTGDRYFSGGFVVELPNQHIARTRDSELYLTARTGVFSYKIPLAPGIYELRLHFAETTYGPASTLGGGENSRVFDVQVNGRSLLSQFDIVSDAGPNTADVRVFRDISPDKDGFLHLDFSGSLGLPMINAIEILPGIAHRLRPIRMVSQNSFYMDKSGNLWIPDTYFSSGQLASDKVVVTGTPEPGLYRGDRYGNFSYALPVDDGTYRMTLYLSEKYWGMNPSHGGAGSRIFDVLCNGVALTRRLDIAREAGPGRALVKVYHGLRPNAQGKLIVSFVPDVNYASLSAIEVEQEGP